MEDRRFVMVDSDLCIGCQTCMAACVSVHDRAGEGAYPRLNLVTTLKVSAPITCHQCLDAPCVEACPTGALYSEDRRIAIRKKRCIGCRNCMLACPYGAITIVPQVATETLRDICVVGYGQPIVVKCDLCENREGGPACVAACPTKGLILVDEKTLRTDIKDKRIDAACATELYRSTLNSAN